MPGHVLLIEDDELLGSNLRRALTASGYRVDLAPTLGEGRALLAQRRPELVLLDLSLPDGDGVDWCAEVQAAAPTLPIIMLTARSEEIDIVIGLNSGAVDYITKPFRLAELTARVEAHLRIANETSCVGAAHRLICQAGVEVDLDSRRVFVEDLEIDLRPREYDLLVRLLVDVGKVVSREQLISEVWDENWYGSTKTLDVHVTHLRRKLGERAAEPSRITSVRGVGYRFELDQSAGPR